TTEVAALVVLALGALAGFGYLVVASGATAVIVLALSEKDRLRAAVARIGAAELRAALQFAVLALVILPLLPDETYGPLGGIRPRALWTVVLIFSGLNFAGYLARKAVGPERGYGVTGALGGLVSSTAVTFQFSRSSRDDPSLGTGLAIGVVAACTVLIPRVMLFSSVLNYQVAIALIPFLVPTFVVGALISAIAMLRRGQPAARSADEDQIRSPLRLGSAIRMALAFQISLMAIAFIRETLGSPGIIASAALLGLTDMDALTLSMNRLGTSSELVALGARAIAVGIISNSLLKLSLVLILGVGLFRRLAAIGLIVLTIVGGAALWIFR
ncbi:MAG: MgtC/SapB family protein, partial [Gemmatimonadaceae bacterium]